MLPKRASVRHAEGNLVLGIACSGLIARRIKLPRDSRNSRELHSPRPAD